MTVGAKTRVVHAALALLALWPAVHLGLVARYDLSPWKLAGWGMYSTPRFGLVGMEIHGRRTGDQPWDQLVDPSAELRALANGFLERHRWLRGLASAGDLVARVRAEHPDWREVRITVAYPAIDRTTGVVVLRRDERIDGG